MAGLSLSECVYMNLVIDQDAYRSQAGSINAQSMLGRTH